MTIAARWTREEVGMLRAMSLIGVVCAAVIVTVYVAVNPLVEANRAQALQKAITDVLPGVLHKRAFRFEQNTFHALPDMSGKADVYAGFDAQGHLTGFAIPAKGAGYQDTIALLYGYRPQEQWIVGLKVLASRETPGLGAKIETDAVFLANFHRLDVAVDAHTTGAIAHPLEVVRSGRKRQPWQIDAISGATVSSQAVGSILRESTLYWIPLIRRHLEEFNHGGDL